MGSSRKVHSECDLKETSRDTIVEKPAVESSEQPNRVEAARQSLIKVTNGKDLSSPESTALRYLDSMFQFERIKTPYGFSHFLLLLYSPFGVLLLVIRMLLFLLAALISPKLLTNEKVTRMMFGTIVRFENIENLDRENPPAIFVSNHVSEFDGQALRSIMPMCMLGYDFYKKFWFYKLLRGHLDNEMIFVPYKSRSEGGAEGREQVRRIVQEKVTEATKPVACFPEGGLTNGTSGILQYHKFMFSLGKDVQPIALKATDGPFPVNINDETSTFAANAFWYLFQPWHVFTMKFLPRMAIADGESSLEFANRVMNATANALDIQATPFLYRDKIKYCKMKKLVMAEASKKTRAKIKKELEKPDSPKRLPRTRKSIFGRKKSKSQSEEDPSCDDGTTSWIDTAFGQNLSEKELDLVKTQLPTQEQMIEDSLYENMRGDAHIMEVLEQEKLEQEAVVA